MQGSGEIFFSDPFGAWQKLRQIGYVVFEEKPREKLKLVRNVYFSHKTLSRKQDLSLDITGALLHSFTRGMHCLVNWNWKVLETWSAFLPFPFEFPAAVSDPEGIYSFLRVNLAMSYETSFSHHWADHPQLNFTYIYCVTCTSSYEDILRFNRKNTSRISNRPVIIQSNKPQNFSYRESINRMIL